MTQKLRNFKPFFLFFFAVFLFFNLRQVSYPPYYHLTIVVRAFHLHFSNCEGILFGVMFPCTIKNLLSFIVFFFNLFLNAVSFFPYFLWYLWRLRVHNSCSSCLVISMGNFRLRVVSGILPAVFFYFVELFFRFTHFAAFSTFLTSLG